MFNFFNLTDLEHLLQLCQKERLFNTVSEGPILQETLEEGYG